MNAKLEPRYDGTLPPVIAKNTSVPTPDISTATFGSKPISSGASTVAPNIATTCCAPIATVCGHGSRSSGAITPSVFVVHANMPVPAIVPPEVVAASWRRAAHSRAC